MSDNIDGTLFEAAGAGDEALVGQLIDQATVDWRDEMDWTALHEAADGGHPPVVTRLLDAGWSLEARSEYTGRTPLSYAAEAGHLETVKCMLIRGANMDTQNDDKRTPLHYASSNGHSKVIKRAEGHTEMIKTLLHCGANQQIRNDQGQTAEDAAKNDETRAVFREFSKKKINIKEEV